MALLSVDKRKEYFSYLKLGTYNKENIKKLQSKYMARKSDADGVYGQNTDNLLRHLYNCHKYLNKDNFRPEEFKCECNGRYCSGYPTYMKPAQLTNLQTIRNKYKKPMTITSGIRCRGWNSHCGGSISNSKHLLGQATDFYMQGVTDTLANRKNFIKYAVGLPNTTYIYGNGCNGYYDSGRWRYGSVSAPYMGNAIHYDTNNGNPTPTPKPTPKPTPDGKLVVDGIGGASTVRAMQKFFSTSIDGVISGQKSSLISKYCPSLKAVSYGSTGSACIKNLQRWVGVTQDGIIGQATVKAWQKKLGVTADGIFGTNSMKKWQTYLNNNDKPVYPPTPTPKKSIKIMDVSEFQDVINWNKVKADGIKGVIVRCGLRGAETGKLKTDPMFLNHIKGAYKVGLPVGIYMFTTAINAKEGKEEADCAIKLWQTAGVPLSFPIAVDTENVTWKEGGKTIHGRSNATKLSKAKRTEAIKAFCEQIKAKGYKPMIYASTSWLNNQLDMSKLPYDVWVAQYNTTCDYKGKYIIWQYTSSGKVAGAKGNIDLNHCYIEPKKVEPPKPTPTPSKQGYQGTFPTLRLKKSNAKVIADTIEWAKMVANNNNFHYGYGRHAHHNGCYYCGTQKLKKGHGIKEYEYTYCCNPFVGAAWAHGAGDATAFKMCNSCNSWDFGTGNGSYHTSKLFDNLGHPAKAKLQAGDVLCNSHHVVLYLGNGKLAEAGHTDDNVINSKSWISSIEVTSLTDSRYKDLPRAYRYNGSVNVNRPITHGEVSDRVGDLQKYLKWYGYDIAADCIFGQGTYDAVKKFQKAEDLAVDGIVGQATIDAMKKVKK